MRKPFMKINPLLVSLLVLITLSSCHRYYTSSSFDAKTARHKSIAILPPQIIITGILPKTLSKSDIEELEETESRLFHRSLYNNILMRASNREYAMYVSVQPYTNTMAILEKNNINVRESWMMDDKELANLLGVDAVVRSSIEKDRFMSDLASASIDVGRKIINVILSKPVYVPVTSKTNDIRASCSIISNGETLWNDYYKRESDWNSPANQVIENITDNFAKHFPYKKKV